MTTTEIFSKLFNGGAFALPYLIEFTRPDSSSLFFVNNNEDVVFNGHLYKASAFSYTEPNVYGEGASLEISLVDNDLFSLIDSADNQLEINIRGCLMEDGNVEAIQFYQHLFGSATISKDKKLSLTLEADDRMKMQFPPYTFDTDNNRGNA